jgi:hypothetical protein
LTARELLPQVSAQNTVVRGLAFPNGEDTPSVGNEKCLITRVALNIALEFLGPELTAIFWSGRLLAIRVAVPKTSMHEDYRSVSREHDIGGAR